MEWSVVLTKLDKKRSKLYFRITVDNANGFGYYLSDKLQCYPMYISWNTERRWWKINYEPEVTVINDVSSHSQLLILNKTIALDFPKRLCDQPKKRENFYTALLANLQKWLKDEYQIYSSRNLLYRN